MKKSGVVVGMEILLIAVFCLNWFIAKEADEIPLQKLTKLDLEKSRKWRAIDRDKDGIIKVNRYSARSNEKYQRDDSSSGTQSDK